MNLRFTPEENQFRRDVRSFLDAELPADIRQHTDSAGPLDKEKMQRWTAILHARGWSAPGWPVAHGGPGWSPVQQYIFGEELQQAPAPPPLPFGVNMVGPVIYTFGSEAQKRRFLPRIANLEDWWCQGFSEPGAGSDLASLRTSARRDGAVYLVNGQKTWTSYAHYANWIFMLVRTDPTVAKQKGISFLLVDMKTPGITVRPLVTLEGKHEVNEVFFDNVAVPAENLVGEENKGWDCAKFLLGNERVSIARVGTSKHRLRRIKEMAQSELRGAGASVAHARLREKIVALEVELQALELTQLRVLASTSAANRHKPNPVSSILKITGSQIQQATTELAMQAAGPLALADAASADWATLVAPTYLNWRKVSIYGGSNEIQKTIIAKAVLGL